MVSTMPWRRLVPNTASLTACPKPPSCASSCSRVRAGGAADCSAAVATLRASISVAESRSIVVSYLPPTGLPARTCARSASVIAPIRQRGGAINVRSTGIGMPLSCNVDTSASPVPSVEITAATSSGGFGTNVSAATRTAFWSRGVNARSACCTRLPSWPRMSPGTSSGNCEQKYTPTPLERMSRTTCSTRCCSAGGASSNSRCASSKTNTSLGWSRSPTSGNCSNSSDNSHSKKLEYSRGFSTSVSAARMLITPRPSGARRIRSASSSAGSPKNIPPPSDSSRSSARMIAPTDGVLTSPYAVEMALRSSTTSASSARRSLRSSSSRPRSSASLNTMSSTPAWVSLSSSIRASSVGPISLTVVRTGWPRLPSRSQNTVGLASGTWSAMPISVMRACSFSLTVPATARPATSPFTSARNTGTPRREKPSASVISVTVLPVPVAPAISPWRLASLACRKTFSPLSDAEPGVVTALPTRIELEGAISGSIAGSGDSNQSGAVPVRR